MTADDWQPMADEATLPRPVPPHEVLPFLEESWRALADPLPAPPEPGG